ncbi:MAG TPA: DUF4249 family protein [Longimicrobiales bacterium]|nr:DUF4249 family protein [Longimicrobiales bacterium]
MRAPTRWARAALPLAALAVGCNSDLGFSVPDPDTFVVQAFVFAGEPVEMTVSGVLAIDADSTAVAEPITTAEISLFRNGQLFTLAPVDDDPGRYRYPGTDLAISVGDALRLEVTYAGTTATAETVVPSPPTGLALSADSLAAPEFGAGFPGGGPGALGGGLVARWDNTARELFFVVVDNVEGDPEPFPTFGFFGRFAPRLTQLPTAADSSGLQVLSLTHYGRHRLRLYRINQEYADLYTALLQDSRDLNEPPSNIRGALGIFSAFSADSAFFNVYDQP